MQSRPGSVSPDGHEKTFGAAPKRIRIRTEVLHKMWIANGIAPRALRKILGLFKVPVLQEHATGLAPQLRLIRFFRVYTVGVHNCFSEEGDFLSKGQRFNFPELSFNLAAPMNSIIDCIACFI